MPEFQILHKNPTYLTELEQSVLCFCLSLRHLVQFSVGDQPTGDLNRDRQRPPSGRPVPGTSVRWEASTSFNSSVCREADERSGRCERCFRQTDIQAESMKWESSCWAFHSHPSGWIQNNVQHLLFVTAKLAFEEKRETNGEIYMKFSVFSLQAGGSLLLTFRFLSSNLFSFVSFNKTMNKYMKKLTCSHKWQLTVVLKQL